MRLFRRSDDGAAAFAFSPDTAAPVGDKPFHLVADGKSDPALAKRLLARYAKKGAKKVEAKRLGLTMTDLVEATRRTAPRIWERHLDLVLDGLRPGPSRPLPGAVPAAKWDRVVAERHERAR